MIKKALLGLALTAVVVLIVLWALGFGLADISDMFGQPYMEALNQGKYLNDMTVRVDGETVSGEQSFELKVRNPTQRELTLKGSWSEAPGRFTVSPAEVELSVPPRDSKAIRIRLHVLERDEKDNPVRISRFKPPVFRGKWIWRKWVPEGQLGEQVEIPVERPLVVRRAFGTLNHTVLIAYLVGMLFIGYLMSRRVTGTRSYFIGDGKVNYIAVGFSILGTYLSALTMMALPGMSYGEHDWTYTIQLPCLVITAAVITGFVLPRYRAAGIISVYEYLERRIDVSARLVAALSFLAFSVARMGLVIYLPALAFSTVTGVPLWLSIVGMASVTTIYTVMGGIEAVIWTDVVQVIVFTVGAFLTLGYIFHDLGARTFVDVGREYNKFRVIIPEFDVAKITTLWLILETIFQTIRIYGTQQDITQRYMTTESTQKANRSVWIGILAYIPIGFIFYLIGTALFVFYKAHPDVNLPGKADPMYPHFVVNHLPPGVAGFVIAAILAAAMSSIDSCMNSSSTVCIEDFYKRLSRKPRSDREYLRKARYLTFLWGLLATLMALTFMKIQYAQIVWGKVMGISTNGVLGLMALAFLPFKVSKWAAAAGFVLSYAALFAMMSSGINFLLWPVIGNSVCFFVGLFLNPLFSGAAPVAAGGRER